MNLSTLKTYLDEADLNSEKQKNLELEQRRQTEEVARQRQIIRSTSQRLYEETCQILEGAQKLIEQRTLRAHNLYMRTLLPDIGPKLIFLILNRDYVRDVGGGIGDYTNYTTLAVTLNDDTAILSILVIKDSDFEYQNLARNLVANQNRDIQLISSLSYFSVPDSIFLDTILSETIVNLLKEIQQQPLLTYYK